MNSPMASARRVKAEQLMYVLIWLTIFNYAIELQYTTHLKWINIFENDTSVEKT